MQLLDRLILGIPYLFLKKIPYAWLGAVFFWSRPQVFSAILLAIVLLGLGMMAWQEQAWERKIRREFSKRGQPYRDQPHAARSFQARNFVLVCAATGLLGWLLQGRLGLTALQWFLLLAGFMLLYKDSLFFGAAVTYLITDQGVGIRFVPGHVDYRLFFKFKEIREAVRTDLPEQVPLRWEVLAPRRTRQSGVLLYSYRQAGFSKQIQGPLFLAPADREDFLEELARHVRITEDPRPEKEPLATLLTK
jgi:hypothetical protein